MLKADLIGTASERSLLDQAAIKAAFVQDARAGTEQYRAQNSAALRRAVAVTPITDGRRGAAPENVRIPGGIYIAEFAVDDGVLAAALAILARVSPVKSGHYKASHRVFINGQEASPPWPEIGAGRVFIANISAYARILEPAWGREAGGGHHAKPSPAAPQGPYRLAQLALTQLFGETYQFRFSFVALDIPGGEAPVRKGKRGKRAKPMYPCLIIVPR